MECNIMGPLNQLGYGVVATNIIHELSKKNVRVNAFSIGNNIDIHQIYHQTLQNALNNNKTFSADAPTIKIWHQWDLSTFVGRGKHIAWTFFELDNLTAYEVHNLNSCHAVIVSSEWAKNVCVNCGVGVPIYVIPLGVNRDIFSALYPPKKTNKTIFGCFGKFEVRKGQDILASAWNQLNYDDVELWLCCDNPFLSEEENNKWKSLFKKPGVKFLPRFKSQDELAYVMSQIDCGVFPTRGEGWNMEVLELMSFGIPSILGNHTGHTQFCNNANSYLVNPVGYIQAYDGVYFKPGLNANQGRWADMDATDFEIEMRGFHTSKPSSKRNAALETAENYTWEKIADKVITCLSEIMKK